MSSRVEFQAADPNAIEFTLTATMSMTDWLKIKDALPAGGAPKTYGATGWLHSAICNMATRAWDKIGEKRE